jgi:hypothetical protein
MFFVIIRGSTSIGDMAMRTEPLPLSVVIGAAARMADSPTTAQIVPATRANMDRWPVMVETERVVEWMYRNRPLPVARWQYECEAMVVNN